MPYRVLALVPAWWNELSSAEGRATSELLRDLGARWGVAVALDPGGSGLCRGGMRFPPRAQRDFFEHLKEALFDAQVEAILAVGEAASIDNLHRAAGWSPGTPRVSLLRRENFAPPWNGQLLGACQLSDLVLVSEPRPAPEGPQTHEWVLTPTSAHVCLELGWRFLPDRAAPTRAARDADPCGVSILALGEDHGLRRRLGRLPFSWEWLTLPRGRGQIAAWNAALKRARYGCLLSLGHRTALSPASLVRMREYLLGEAPLSAVGAMRGRPPRHGSREQLAAARILAGKGHRECATSVDPFCWMLRRDAAALVGGLDDRYRTWFGAVFDYCLRLRQLGLRLLNATDVLAFPPPEPPLPPREAAADLDLMSRKWCLEATSALELLCRKEPT